MYKKKTEAVPHPKDQPRTQTKLSLKNEK